VARAAERSDGRPCLKIPRCPAFASAHQYVDTVTPPTAPIGGASRVDVCYTAAELVFRGNASDQDVFNSAAACNAQTFAVRPRPRRRAARFPRPP
jgi:hypothetical protein